MQSNPHNFASFRRNDVIFAWFESQFNALSIHVTGSDEQQRETQRKLVEVPWKNGRVFWMRTGEGGGTKHKQQEDSGRGQKLRWKSDLNFHFSFEVSTIWLKSG